MRIFLTGATGFIGSWIVPDLIAAGHEVVGLTRSDAGAKALVTAGAQPYHGTIDKPEGLKRAAADADAVIHTAFDHDFAHFVENCDKDRRVIEALGAALAGSGRPLVVTSGIGFGARADGDIATEDVFNPGHGNPRVASEQAADKLVDDGIRAIVVRLPQVHDPVKQGLITPMVAATRDKGRVAYVGDGANRWPACHVDAAARVYRLAAERGVAGERFHAVAEEGIATRAIAEVLGRGLRLPAVSITPDEAPAHFGWLAPFATMDMPASSALTRARLDWQPSGPGLLADLAENRFTESLG